MRLTALIFIGLGCASCITPPDVYTPRDEPSSGHSANGQGLSAKTSATTIAEGEEEARKIEKNIGILFGESRTTCRAMQGKQSGTVSFVLESPLDMYSSLKTKKPWLLVAVGAIGSALNENPNMIVDRVFLVDAGQRRSGRAYVADPTTLKHLQWQIKNNRIRLDEMYSKIVEALKDVEAPPQEGPGGPWLQDEEAPKQDRRLEYIQKLIDMGILQKVTYRPGGLPKVYVRPAFYGLDFDDKRLFMGVIGEYYKRKHPDSYIVVIRDSRTHKEVGKYSGGRLYLK